MDIENEDVHIKNFNFAETDNNQKDISSTDKPPQNPKPDKQETQVSKTLPLPKHPQPKAVPTKTILTPIKEEGKGVSSSIDHAPKMIVSGPPTVEK